MSTYTPSPTFESAAAYLSNASSLSSVSNTIKLELYGLYKYLTASHAPNTSRPSIFDMTGRAKWDAWSAANKSYGDRVDGAEARYIAIARSLGWSEDKTPEDRDEGELDLDSDDEGETSRSGSGGGGSGSGLGASVSMMSASREKSGSVLSDLAIAGDARGLRTFLGAHPDADINTKDENGYTPFHLACDRGHADVVRLLLERGADPSIKVITILMKCALVLTDYKDDDDLTGRELAEISGHDGILNVLKTD
ncbi:hypothetical protein FOMPIDRAFT_1046491 [Fomitopsis schrenkii]|uniref:ACB domain-containing protein n=1 Tax=Fomitopsis schrenkii TaxID=2126942 RepID=S8EID6_FOMSC|nr:hypothetical protein FOMPIDRAFT_1046491 [Fomitopsis schrenkii]